ncbi:MAG: Crp/Fnr family transcriptional regulator [Candidatus Dormibacteria bacterium]
MDTTRVLLGSYLFQDLTPDVLEPLAASLGVRRVRAGQHIFRHGDPANEVWVVVSGQVREYTVDDHGNEYIFEVHGPGAVFGEPSTFAGQRYRVVNEVAMVPTVVVPIGRDVLLDFMSNHREVLLRLLEGLASEARIAVEEVPRAARSTVYSRIVDRLVVLVTNSRSAGSAPGAATRVNVTQSELAGMVGCTRENANRALNELAHRGLIEVKRGAIVVPELSRLQAITRPPEWFLRRRNAG